MIDSLKYYFHLSKLKIMLPVSLTGFTGYFIQQPSISGHIFFVSLGILLVGVSASVLNQVQEADIDSRMKRTQDRPIPSGRISKGNALLFFLLTLVSGSFLILIFGNVRALSVSFFTVFWYNYVYTYSKRLTPFAVFPGAITGALPPLIGWLAAGGGFFDRTIVMVEFLFFVGQMPHFWIIVLKYGEEYEKAGLPCLTRVMQPEQISRLVFIWIALSGMAALFLYLFGIIHTEFIASLILVSTTILIVLSAGLLRSGKWKTKLNRYNLQLNVYFLLIMVFIVSDRLISEFLL